MRKLIIDGNKVYTIDEACMRRKNMTISQIREMETQHRRQDAVETRKRK